MNDKNLGTPYTSSVAREMGRLGGIASGKAKRERAAVSAMYAKFLAKKTNVPIDGRLATGIQLLEYAVKTVISEGSDNAKVSLMKEMREALEGSKVQFSGVIVETDYRDLTDEQRAALRAANETLLEAGL